jgi:hypothetical protein
VQACGIAIAEKYAGPPLTVGLATIVGIPVAGTMVSRRERFSRPNGS